MGSRVVFLLAVAVPSALVAQAKPADSPSVTQFDPKEWEVPYGADTRPRDPYADAQGRVWFVGQNGNYIAYLDNKTGNFKRFEIDPGTNPHNLVVEKGMVWFTGNRNNRIVKLDPATGKLTTYMIPDAAVRDPHTMTFDPKSGHLYLVTAEVAPAAAGAAPGRRRAFVPDSFTVLVVGE